MKTATKQLQDTKRPPKKIFLKSHKATQWNYNDTQNDSKITNTETTQIQGTQDD